MLFARKELTRSEVIAEADRARSKGKLKKAMAGYRKALELALTPEPGETLSSTMISRVAGNHPDMAFDWAVAHKDAVNEKVDNSARTRFIPGLASSSSNPATAEKVKAYAAANLAEGSRKEADKAAASVLNRSKIRQQRLPAITAWVAKNS